jgi:hypothetical protein
MPTGTAATTARRLSYQVIHTLVTTMNWNDVDVAGRKIGTLPRGACILLSSSINVNVAFNAGTTNNLLVGKTAGGNDYCVTGTSAAGSVGVKAFAAADITGGSAGGVMTADQDIYVSYTQTGGAATAGQATVTVSYSLPQ